MPHPPVWERPVNLSTVSAGKTMTQPRQSVAQRRTSPTDSGAFSFSYLRSDDAAPVSAWMLKRGEEEAAFLTPTSEAPRVGERLVLNQPEYAEHSRSSTTAHADTLLPRFGRVIRLGALEGAARRIAIRFEK